MSCRQGKSANEGNLVSAGRSKCPLWWPTIHENVMKYTPWWAFSREHIIQSLAGCQTCLKSVWNFVVVDSSWQLSLRVGCTAGSHDLYGRIKWQLRQLESITNYRVWRNNGGHECVAWKRSLTVPVAMLIHSGPAPTRFQHPIPNRAEAWCEVGVPGSKGCSRVRGPAALTPVI